MPPRPGHHRPLGTLTAPWRFSWGADEPPRLGDVALHTPYEGGDPDECQRAYLVVGIAETASNARPYRLTFERVAYDTRPYPGRRVWHFHNA